MKDILVTNDDGFDSKGLNKLVKMLRKEFKAKVTVVAPASEKSACAHSISLKNPLKLIKLSKRFYKLDDGTPSDCIYLALFALYKKKLPDLVISGINHGANISEDITYSGTCAGAMEAVLQGIPAVALSQYYTKKEDSKNLDFSKSLKILKKIIASLLKDDFPLDKKQFLNINFPSANTKFKGLKVARAGKRVYNYKAYEKKNPHGMKYYWLGTSELEHIHEKDSDVSLLLQGYATITPIMLDLTAYDKLEKVRKWIENAR